MKLSGRSALSGDITRIQGNRVTVREGAGREAALEGQDTRALWVGDSVRVQEGRILKVGALPEPIPSPQGAGKAPAPAREARGTAGSAARGSEMSDGRRTGYRAAATPAGRTGT